MLYCAHDKDVTISEMLNVLDELGYRIGEREVKQELEKLTLDNFLTAHNEGYSITGTGIEEFKDIRTKLRVLYSEVINE